MSHKTNSRCFHMGRCTGHAPTHHSEEPKKSWSFEFHATCWKGFIWITSAARLKVKRDVRMFYRARLWQSPAWQMEVVCTTHTTGCGPQNKGALLWLCISFQIALVLQGEMWKLHPSFCSLKQRAVRCNMGPAQQPETSTQRPMRGRHSAARQEWLTADLCAEQKHHHDELWSTNMETREVKDLNTESKSLL